ncbi:hypothetical protein MFIFM68171_11105 [Madurella fahalii]|uniref:Uncharacterized protein n=1 Tax=Madurella fahalii TaxID=1157608 RepID=A0ABQ0GT30_9PEZI
MDEPDSITTVGNNIHIRVKRSHWKCCSCGSLVSCEIGGFYLMSSTMDCYPNHCRDGCAVCERAICPTCNKRRCSLCVYVNPEGKEISTVGGKNLIHDRFKSAAWYCCICGKIHCPEPAPGHPDTHVTIPIADGNVWHIQHTCFGGHSQPERPCDFCDVLNRYGELILQFGDMTRGEDPIPILGPLYEHALWCDLNLAWVRRTIDEHNTAAAENQELESSATARTSHYLLRLVVAENLVAEPARIEKDEIAPWITLQKAAIEAARRRVEVFDDHESD